MRLNNEEIELILNTIETVFGSVGIYLFGSRLDNNKKGGDIDLFIVPNERSNLLEKKIKVLAKLERILNKPVDIVIHKNFNREIEKEILKKACCLREKTLSYGTDIEKVLKESIK